MVGGRRVRTRKCGSCLRVFEAVGKAIYCSVFCRQQAPRKKFDLKCQRCGGEFQSARRFQECCSISCASSDKNAWRRRPECACQWCGARFWPKCTGYVTFCGRPCAFARKKANAKHPPNTKNPADWRTWPVINCLWCGLSFHRKHAETHCSPWCQLLTSKERAVQQWKQEYVPRRRAGHCAICCQPFIRVAKGSLRLCDADLCRSTAKKRHKKRAKQRRRAIKKGVVHVAYDRQDIFRRDNWTCQLCGEPADREAKVPHPRAPTIDHIIPLVRRGPDAPANVQCAHFICNSLKRDRVDVEEGAFGHPVKERGR